MWTRPYIIAILNLVVCRCKTWHWDSALSFNIVETQKERLHNLWTSVVVLIRKTSYCNIPGIQNTWCTSLSEQQRKGAERTKKDNKRKSKGCQQELQTCIKITTTKRTPATHAIPFRVTNTGLSNHHAAESKRTAQPPTICTKKYSRNLESLTHISDCPDWGKSKTDEGLWKVQRPLKGRQLLMLPTALF